MARPGDRSRRDDDRYLMLEALLAAREKLYISWVGRNVRDNSLQPPSVLVAQLRDYLAAGWKFDPVSLTTEHALQPFSRRYFEQGGLLTYAGEWRAAHGKNGTPLEAAAGVLAPFELDPQWRLTLAELASFVRQPVKHFFRRRLSVVFVDSARLGEDEEPFALNALERYVLEDAMLEETMMEQTMPEQMLHRAAVPGGGSDILSDVRASLALRADQLAREGVLPIGLLGQQWQRQLVDALVPVRRAWLALCLQYPQAADKVALALRYGDVGFEDWLDQLRSDGSGGKLWLLQMSSKVLDKKKQPRGDKLIRVWLRQLAAAAANCPVSGILVARDAVLRMSALDPDAARAALQSLFALWRSAMDGPMPTACKTALALLQGADARSTYDGGFQMTGERDDLCLARLWPDFASLEKEEAWLDCSRELYGPLLDWLQHGVVIEAIGAQGETA
jgi:exodeoxyribonuclease V gamma subunit